MGIILYPDDYNGEVLSGVVAELPAGVVFLPAAGGRSGYSVTEYDTAGFYWSASMNGWDDAYRIRFKSYEVVPSSGFRHSGFSVRLVSEI